MRLRITNDMGNRFDSAHARRDRCANGYSFVLTAYATRLPMPPGSSSISIAFRKLAVRLRLFVQSDVESLARLLCDALVGFQFPDAEQCREIR